MDRLRLHLFRAAGNLYLKDSNGASGKARHSPRALGAGLHLPSDYLLQADGFWAKRPPVILIDLLVIAHSRTGEADQLPAQHIDIPSVHGIAEHAFDGVSAKQ